MPVTTSPEQVLAELERAAQADGVGLDEIDGHIADALQVPRSYYFAYLLVRNAVEARCEVQESMDPRCAHDAGDSAAVLARAEALTHRIGAHAGALYRHTAIASGGPSTGRHDPTPASRPDRGGSRPDRSDGATEAADQASQILASVVTLRQLLRDVQPEQLPKASAHIRRFDSVGVVGRG